jgi:hypothetical protein
MRITINVECPGRVWEVTREEDDIYTTGYGPSSGAVLGLLAEAVAGITAAVTAGETNNTDEVVGPILTAMELNELSISRLQENE